MWKHTLLIRWVFLYRPSKPKTCECVFDLPEMNKSMFHFNELMHWKLSNAKAKIEWSVLFMKPDSTKVRKKINQTKPNSYVRTQSVHRINQQIVCKVLINTSEIFSMRYFIRSAVRVHVWQKLESKKSTENAKNWPFWQINFIAYDKASIQDVLVVTMLTSLSISRSLSLPRKAVSFARIQRKSFYLIWFSSATLFMDFVWLVKFVFSPFSPYLLMFGPVSRSATSIRSIPISISIRLLLRLWSKLFVYFIRFHIIAAKMGRVMDIQRCTRCTHPQQTYFTFEYW